MGGGKALAAGMAAAAWMLAGCSGGRLPAGRIERGRQEVTILLHEGKVEAAWREYMAIAPHARGRELQPLLAELAGAVLRQGLRAPEPAARAEAIKALARADDALAYAETIRALSDPDPSVVIAALDVLGGLGRRDAVTEIGKLLQADKNDPPARTPTEVEMTAAWAVAALGVRKLPVAPAVTGLSAPRMHVREAAARALGELASPDSLPALRHAMQTDTECAVRAAAAQALFSLGQLADVDRFALAAAESGLPDRVVWALRLREERGRGPGIDWVLKTAVFDPAVTVRVQAAVMLGRLGVGAAAPQLHDMLLSLDPEVKVAAAYGLCQMHIWKHFDALKAGTHHPSPAVRRASICFIESLRPGRYPAIYDRLMSDPDPDVRLAATVGARRLAACDSLPLMARRMGDDDARVRFAAAAMIRRKLAQAGE